ncbi:MAG: hypothetical protein E7059_02230 [Treponema bryantii]|nr:hypothetical protein [Treponema bryantii]
MNNTISHSELCEKTAKKFVKTFALWEVKGRVENPDVITWNSSGMSTVFEIKMSRNDFLADKKKKCRVRKKVCGDFHAYVCYGDFIKLDEIPDDWGLYYFINNKFKCIRYQGDFKSELKEKDWRSEMIMLTNYILCSNFYDRKNIIFNNRYKEN